MAALDPMTLAMMGSSIMSSMDNRDRYDRQMQLKAHTQRLSPWTGLGGDQVEEVNPWGEAAQGLAGIAGYQQNQERAEMAKKFTDAQIEYMNRGRPQATSPLLSPEGTSWDRPKENPYAFWHNEYRRPLGRR